MRPHKLIMKAFGPFAQETEVDFDAMSNEVYLITGATGSGKTTIFDGIVYALFGTASGKGRCGLNNTEAFHSDYAKQGSIKSEMQVQLTFSNAGRDYNVQRRMYWGKNGGAQKAAKESVLYENGEMIAAGKGLENRDEVSKKIEEILGLDASQFRKIIMLAQGEFQQFLMAGSEERGNILGKLYDNRRHQDLQNRLKAAYMLLNDRLKFQTQEVEAQVRLFNIPDDVSAETTDKISANHPELLHTLKEITEKISEEAAHISDEKKRLSAQKEQLSEARTRAERNNELLDKLDIGRKNLENLNAREDIIDKLKLQLEAAVKAQKVLPDRLALDKVTDEIIENDKKIALLEKTRDELAIQEQNLKSQAEKIQKENSKKTDEMKSKMSKINDMMHYYDDLEISSRDYENKRSAYERAENELNKVKENIEQAGIIQEGLKSELEILETAGEAAISLEKNILDEIDNKIAQLAELKTEVQKTSELSAEKTKLEKKLHTAQGSSLTAEEEHLRLNKAFLNGQAGILAKELRTQLQSEETVMCPVCGSIHSPADAGAFAQLHSDVPTKEAVDAALDKWNKAKEKENSVSKSFEGTKKEYELSFDNCMKKAVGLLGEISWEKISESDVIENAENEQNEFRKEAYEAYNKAVKDADRKNKAQEEKKLSDKNITKLQNLSSELVSDVNNLITELKLSEQKVSECSKQLEGFPESKDAALEYVQSLQDNILELDAQTADITDRYNTCVQQQAENKGNLVAALEEQKNKKAERDRADNNYNDALKKQNFADDSDYYRALSPEGRMLSREELDTWIKANTDKVNRYKDEVSNAQITIKTLESSTRGAKREDTDALSDSIDQMTDDIEKLEEKQTNLASKLDINRQVMSRVSALDKERKLYERVEKKLSPLAKVADDKYSFSRYVLGDFFNKIIDQANIHLAEMTDGEYCLIRTENGDGRTSQGLGLKVLNTITDTQRETATLSGGQSFEASLSLALGLSDIVQMESASTIQIDSMFIDEGFGSLDSGRLDKAISVLNHLAAGKRQIGIISHVARLEECLPKKIHVIEGKTGSSVRIETDE